MHQLMQLYTQHSSLFSVLKIEIMSMIEETKHKLMRGKIILNLSKIDVIQTKLRHNILIYLRFINFDILAEYDNSTKNYTTQLTRVLLSENMPILFIKKV